MALVAYDARNVEVTGSKNSVSKSSKVVPSFECDKHALATSVTYDRYGIADLGLSG